MEKRNTIIIAVAIVVGLAVNALFMGHSLERFKKEDRFISVKGLAEKEVKADLAVWTIKARVANNDLLEGSKAIENVKDQVIAFLKKNGIRAKEIVLKDLIVNDRMAQEYGNFNANSGYRYLITKNIQVRSNNVENVQNVSRMTDELLKAGVVVSQRNEYEGGNVQYYFTGLNGIKPAMLSEATRNAKDAAIQFTKESETKLGKLRKASQGLFSIADRDESLSSPGEAGYANNVSDIYKKVRVVINVEYSVE